MNKVRKVVMTSLRSKSKADRSDYSEILSLSFYGHVIYVYIDVCDDFYAFVHLYIEIMIEYCKKQENMYTDCMLLIQEKCFFSTMEECISKLMRKFVLCYLGVRMMYEPLKTLLLNRS
jgi:hypothetical protein